MDLKKTITDTISKTLIPGGSISDLKEFQQLKIFECTSANRNPKNPLIVTRLPPEITMSLNQDYIPFGDGAITGTLGNILNTLGISLTFKWMDLQLWQGSKPISFELPIKLVARTDAFVEVFLPAMQLMGLALPRVGKLSALIPPGPDILQTINSQWTNMMNSVFTIVGAKTNPDLAQVTDANGEPRKQYANDFVEAARRTIDDLNLFSYGQSMRNTLFGSENFGRTLTVEFGTILKFKEMIIERVTVIWGAEGAASNVPLNSDGFPLAATVLLDVKGSRVYTKQKYGDHGDSYSEYEQLQFANRKRQNFLEAKTQPSPIEKHIASATRDVTEIYKRFLRS